MQHDGGATNTSVLADVFEAYLGGAVPRDRYRARRALPRGAALRARRPGRRGRERRQDRAPRVHPRPLLGGADLLRTGRGPAARPAFHLPSPNRRRGRGRRDRRVEESCAAECRRDGAGLPAQSPPRTRAAGFAAADTLTGGARDRASPVPQSPRSSNEGTLTTDATQDAQSFRLQDLCRIDAPRLQHRHHRGRRPERFGQIESRRRDPLGAGRAEHAQPALAAPRGRDLRRQHDAQAARHGRGVADVRQLRSRAADRLRRSADHAARVPRRRIGVLHQSQRGAFARRGRTADGNGPRAGLVRDRLARADRRDPVLEADRTPRAVRRDGRHR